MNEETAKLSERHFDRGDARASARCAKPQWDGLSWYSPGSPHPRPNQTNDPDQSVIGRTQRHTADRGRHAQRRSGMEHARRSEADPMSPGRVPTERGLVFHTSGSAPTPKHAAEQRSAAFSTSSAACCRPKKQFFPQGGMPGRRQKDVQKQYGISHRRWNAYMKALHGNGSESDGWNSDVEREVSRETEEMRGEPQLQPESLPSLRARAEQVAALCEQSIASGQPVSRAQISALPAPGAADKACSECSNTNPNPARVHWMTKCEHHGPPTISSPAPCVWEWVLN